MTPRRRDGRSALILLVASGAVALAHQLVWTRRLVDILGASPETFSRVVGAFCAGLSLGGAWAALRPALPDLAWRRIALAEFTVGILGAGVLLSLPMADALHRGGFPTGGIRWLLPILLITPPAVAMGLVLPAALATAPGIPLNVRAYAANTLGGVLGILLTGFLLLPTLGLTGTGIAACAGSVAIAAAAALLQRPRRDPEPAPIAEPGAAGAPMEVLRFGGVLAFLSGFLVLGLEVVSQHQLAQVTIHSQFSSASILVVVLASLFCAALVVTRWRGSAEAGIRNAVLLAAVLWMFQPLVFLALRPGLRIISYELPPALYALQVAFLSAFTVAPGFLAAGLLFPLLLRSAPDPRTVARWLALNGLGGWLGAEWTQGIALPAFGLWRTPIAAAAAYLVVAIGLRVTRPPPSREPCRVPASGWLAPLALTIVWVLLWPRARHWPQVGPTPGERVVEVAAGREGVVATVVRDTNDWRIVFNNTYTLGGSRAQANQERQAHLPLLLHGHPETVALLGVATGSTLAGAALHTHVQALDAFELSPLAARFASNHFAPFHRQVFSDPRVHLTLEDARWAVSREPGRYDVVIGDLFLPWRTGEGRLYSREHFSAVRTSLRPDGLFCQWLPLFQLTRVQFDVIVRTFLAEFPNAFLLRGDFYPELPIVGLCAFADGTPLGRLDWSRVRDACARLHSREDVSDPLVRHPEGVAMCVVGDLPNPGPGPVNTLGNAWLEWDAGRNIVGLQSPWFIGVPEAEYLREILRTHPGPLPPSLREAQDSGQFFLTLEVARRVNAPVLNNLAAQVPARLPSPLRGDSGADWTQWPGQMKPSPSASIHPSPEAGPSRHGRPE